MNIKLEDHIDYEYIELQLLRLKAGQIKLSTLESYTSRSLRSSDGNFKDWINNRIIRDVYKYQSTKGGL